MAPNRTAYQFLNELTERRQVKPFRSRIAQNRKCQATTKSLRIFCDS